MTDVSIRTIRWMVVRSSVPITNLSDMAYGYTLKALKYANTGMDSLVSDTPRLIRETLGSAAQQSGVASQKDEMGKPVMPEATDVAREANEALHRVFHKEEGIEADVQGTLLVEARLLVWHAWLLVGLQITAVRSILQVMEGMFTWVSQAWLQLLLGASVLTAMACIAPLAGGAAVVAWSSHFILTQILSLRTYEEAARSYWAPPLHSALLGLQEWLSPYLEVPLQEEQGVKEREQPPAGPAGATQGEEEEESFIRAAGATAWHAAEMGMDGVKGMADTARASLGAGLAALEQGARRLVPAEKQKAEEGIPAEGTKADLLTAASSAEEAWQRASSLAAAAAWTVLDAGRMLVIATAQRFMLPLPMWLLSPSSSAQQLSQTPSIEEFNLSAGKGPAATQEGRSSGAQSEVDQQQKPPPPPSPEQQQQQQKQQQQKQQLEGTPQQQKQGPLQPKEHQGQDQNKQPRRHINQGKSRSLESEQPEQKAQMAGEGGKSQEGFSGLLGSAREGAKSVAKATVGGRE
ncbi:hypothetical protein DUNSADRAFT_4237 [Dunaliella salina]|uniref:Uncharacterized protein n=1 Tax=Dunaliella salina TaxID=3046 RepID=A0ABQ7GSF3_DUNSA|nr:hypothetical protein DUNSADRAFT_4237 [Dunaliella salina]|eukprot:KAF5837544.1 hypothetical protein DUNSADRAFT_4237 [Dunaliella salina]